MASSREVREAVDRIRDQTAKPFYLRPYDRFGRPLAPIRVNDPKVPRSQQWRQAVLWASLAIDEADQHPPKSSKGPDGPQL
jgi:hypothetical protein